MNEHEGKRCNTREPLGAHVTVGPLNTPIQREAILRVSESKSDTIYVQLELYMLLSGDTRGTWREVAVFTGQ